MLTRHLSVVAAGLLLSPAAAFAQGGEAAVEAVVTGFLALLLPLLLSVVIALRSSTETWVRGVRIAICAFAMLCGVLLVDSRETVARAGGVVTLAVFGALMALAWRRPPPGDGEA